MGHNPRYNRQITLPEIGSAGQQKLSEASVLVTGAGGLGCPALMYLTAAGVGSIGIVDGDKVELSNLHRQVLYDDSDVGKPKAKVAAKKLREKNPQVEFQCYPEWLNNQNAMQIISGYDIVIDGTDNFPTRYLINDACIFLNKPFVYASIYRFDGQLSLFNCKDETGKRGPNYRDLFPEPPPAELAPDCSEVGVLGVLPGIMGTMQATEVIKWITGTGELLNGKLLIFETSGFDSQKISIKKRADNPVTGVNPTITELIDYEAFCTPEFNNETQKISPKQLKSWMDNGQNFRLIDVRSREEHLEFNIGGELIPLDELNSDTPIQPEQRTVFYCRTGRRSAEAVKRIKKDSGENLFSLKGGVEAWKRNLS